MITHAARRGFSISIFLPDGMPESVRIIEKSNWTGKAVACTRSQYVDVRKRQEFERPGIYVLYGPNADASRRKVYIGESDDTRSRMNMHLKEKDFWESAILFTSKDENLNKAHTRYIEARLISAAQAAKRVELDNGTVPPVQKLSEQEAAYADAFCDEMLLIYPVLGVDAFEPLQEQVTALTLYLAGPGASAKGARSQEKFVVYAGSFARADTVPSMPVGYHGIRESLVASGLLTPTDEGLRLEEDYVFDSASAAGAVFLGRSANGLHEWKDASGQSLKQLELAATPDAAH